MYEGMIIAVGKAIRYQGSMEIDSGLRRREPITMPSRRIRGEGGGGTGKSLCFNAKLLE